MYIYLPENQHYLFEGNLLNTKNPKCVDKIVRSNAIKF